MAVIREAPSYQQTFTKVLLHYANVDYLQGTDTTEHLGKCIELAKGYLRDDAEMFSAFKGKFRKSKRRKVTLVFKYNKGDFKPLKKFSDLYLLYDYNKKTDIVVLIGIYGYSQNF